VRPAAPEIRDPKFEIRNPIDAFILERLQREQLAPSGDADKIALCRRLYLDLIGLPPSPKEVDEYLADTRANAYEKLVEEVARLAAPRRTLGPHLARRRPLRRLGRLRKRHVAPGLDVSRLGL